MLNLINDTTTDAKLLDFSIEIYRKKLKTLVGFQILFMIVMSITIMAGSVILIPTLHWIDFGGVLGIFFFMFILLIVVGVYIGIDKVGIFHITYSYLKGKDITAAEAIGKAFESIKAITKIVILLATCLLPVIGIITMMEINAATITLWQNRLATNTALNFLVNVVIYSFVTALVGSYLFYSLHIAVFERTSGVAAIKKSIKLAKGEGLKNIHRVFSIFMIQWAVQLSIYSTVGAISGLLYFLLGKMQTGYSVVTEVILISETLKPYLNFLLGILLTPIAPIIWTLYYVKIRYKKEGLEIQNMLDQLLIKDEARSLEIKE